MEVGHGHYTKEDVKKAKEQILIELSKNHCIITPVLRKLHIASNTYWKWRREDKEFDEDVRALDDEVCDFVESKLYELIEKNNEKAILFYLRTKGSRRGFIEKQEQHLQVEDGTIELKIK